MAVPRQPVQRADADKVTGLLKAWVKGDADAQSELMPLVYDQLHRLARHYRKQGRRSDTIQTTALVHEAYLRLVNINDVDWHDRTHFFAVAAQLMRRILVDVARAQRAAKRGGAEARLADIALDDIPAPDSDRGADIIALHEALTELEAVDRRRARVVEMRIFGGLTHQEVAEVLGISAESVMRDWRLAKALLLRELSRARP
jgi:RNA polymerase sigma factor (TIGR02999 family)